MRPRCVGSPPRMRGKVYAGKVCALLRWITPAYAGKRITLSRTVDKPSDHPRVCGEKKKRSAPSARSSGSPPRMRGKGRPTAYRSRKRGITPAYAGKSERIARDTKIIEDHPRVCGEKAVSVALTTRLPGSPPRMRGKVRYFRTRSRKRGITPAYAGKRTLGRVR